VNIYCSLNCFLLPISRQYYIESQHVVLSFIHPLEPPHNPQTEANHLTI